MSLLHALFDDSGLRIWAGLIKRLSVTAFENILTSKFPEHEQVIRITMGDLTEGLGPNAKLSDLEDHLGIKAGDLANVLNNLKAIEHVNND